MPELHVQKYTDKEQESYDNGFSDGEFFALSEALRSLHRLLNLEITLTDIDEIANQFVPDIRSYTQGGCGFSNGQAISDKQEKVKEALIKKGRSEEYAEIAAQYCGELWWKDKNRKAGK